MTAMLEGVEPISGENTNGEDAIQSQILECSTRPTRCPQAEVQILSRDAIELVPIVRIMWISRSNND